LLTFPNASSAAAAAEEEVVVAVVKQLASQEAESPNVSSVAQARHKKMFPICLNCS
jgi:hypothetical protein